MFKRALRKVWAIVVLGSGIVFSASIVGTYLLVFGVAIGAPLAVNGSRYWFEVWIAYDKLWNAILKGSHLETLSSRLGKSTLYNRAPVFATRKIDNIVAWLLHQVDHNHCENSINWKVGDGL